MSEATTAYARHEGLEAVEMDGDLVMMGLDHGEYYALRNVAATLWNELGEPRTLDDLSAVVARDYDVTVQQCRGDVQTVLGDPPPRCRPASSQRPRWAGSTRADSPSPTTIPTTSRATGAHAACHPPGPHASAPQGAPGADQRRRHERLRPAIVCPLA